jgi:hypothetical protein
MHKYKSDRILWFIILIFSSTILSAAQQADKNHNIDTTFFLGSHLCRFLMPEMEELKADIKNNNSPSDIICKEEG